MQTIYYTTANFMRRTDNVVDFGEYRRKLAMAQEGSLAPQAWAAEEDWDQEPIREIHALDELDQPAPRPRTHQRRERRALMLDMCASVGVLAMTLTFTLRLLLG